MANQISVNTGTGNQQVTVTSTGNIQVTTSRAVIGTVANVASANFANYAGNVTVANQPNITGVGTLGNLTVANTITTLNLNVIGNLAVGNLVANSANFANFANVAYNVSGSNVSGAVNLANYATVANSVAGGNVSGAVGLATYATTANAVAGANVSGQVAYAAVANSVAVANVSGIGNIAITNYDGNGSNILHGNGYWGPEIGPQSVANANYANFAGTAYSVSGSNVVGAVANAVYADSANTANLATYATTANSVAGANVSGVVANAAHALFAENSNTSASANSVAGANVSGQVANALVAGTVYTNAQPNITSVGTLTGLTVNGNISANVITANTFVGNIALTQVDYIDFDTANGAPSFQTGRVAWNSSKGTLTVGMNGTGNIDQQIGEDQYIYVKANATISAGQVVMFNGVQGDTILGAPANTSSAGFIPRYVIGVAPADIATGNGGYVQTFGEVYNLQTNAFPAGSILYLQSNSNGAMTTTVPTAPDPKIVLAACLTQSSTPSATNGRIQVRPETGLYMDQLHNVSNVTAVTGDVLVYNSSNVYTPSNTVPLANLATYATTANSVAVGNVVGIGNIATTNYDGNASNVLYGNGGFYALPTISNVANANYANFAGTAYSVSGANVSGEVANANYASYANNANLATYATTANAVAGANVSGIVANANYSAYAGQANTANLATYATTANSVALANVSGAGNIASLNLDGNASNILFGNGVFSAIPVVSNVANANFANFAGTAYSVSGANVSGEVANANYSTYSGTAASANSVAGANVSGQVSYAAVANSVALANVSGAGNIASLNLDGNASNILFGNGTFSAIPTVSNVANANYSNFAGTAYSVSGSNVSGDVSGANHANIADSANSVAGANVSGAVGLATYATTANSVAGANVSGQVSYAAVANSVALANVSGAGNIASINLDGSSSNVLYGNGVFAPESQTGNANYAAYAGNVTVAAQANITSLGNLVSLTINNGNVTLPTKQFNPNGITVGTTANINLMANSSFVDVDYGNGQGGGNLALGKSTTYVKARGNSSAIATAATNDRVGRTNYMFYNGTSNVLAAATQVSSFIALNGNANAVTTAGAYNIITSSNYGDQANANALSNQNLFTFDQGRLTISPGAAGGTSAALVVNSYGGASGNAAAQSQGIILTRQRGNRDGNLSVQPGDQIGYLQFAGYNGTSQYTTRTAGFIAAVDSTYVANSTIIPVNFKVTAAGNLSGTAVQYETTYYSNGNVVFSTYSNNSAMAPTTVFVSSLDASANANIAGNLNVTTNANITGNVSAANVTVNTSGFMKLANYTASALNAITGSIGWMAAVSDSTPGGMLAYWDTTNSRWSYVHDNSAV